MAQVFSNLALFYPTRWPRLACKDAQFDFTP